MKTIRLFAPLLSLAAILALAAGCAVNQKKLAGRINGTPIPYADYMESYRGHYNNFQILNNRPPDSEEKEAIRRQTWNDATKHVILKDCFRKYDIRVSAQEVLDTLRNSIPDYILGSRRFQTDGAFDSSIYLQSLQYDSPENLRPLRDHYQNYVIPILKLQKEIPARELLTPAAEKMIARILASQAEISWIQIDPAKLDAPVSDEEVLAYYNAHPEQFKLDPFYSLGYLAFKVTPSKTDIQASVLLADSLYQELQRGVPLDEVVAKNAATHPQLALKNSGFLRNADLDPQLYALLCETPEGASTRPVVDAEGLTIYQLEQRTKSMCSFNSLRVPYLPSPTSVDLELPAVTRAAKLVATIGWEEAARELERPAYSEERIAPEADWLGDPQVSLRLRDQLRGREPGAVSEPVYSPLRQAWIVAQITQDKLDSTQDLKSVSAQIRTKLSTEKSLQLAQNIARQISAGQIPPPGEAVLSLTRGGQTELVLAGIPAPNLFYQALHAHFQKQLQQPHMHQGQVWLAQVLKVQTDPAHKTGTAEIQAVFAQNLPTDWFETWMEKQVQKAKVQIYRQ